MAFSAEEFLSLIRAGLEPGSFILADEIGAWFGARDWHSKGSRNLTKIIEIFRQYRLGVVGTAPLFGQADKTMRTMSDVVIEINKVIRRAGFTGGKYKNIEVNPITNNIMYKFPVIPTENGKVTTTEFYVDKAPKELVDAYLERKKEFLEEKTAEIHHSLMDKEKDEQEDIRQRYKCKSCGYLMRSNAIKPRCGRCDSRKLAVV